MMNHSDTLALELDVPGFRPENLELQTIGRKLYLKGKTDKRYLNESWTLPFVPDPTAIEAKLEYGVLQLQIKKPADLSPRMIPITVT